MLRFIYTAIDGATGRQRKGTVDAMNQDAAVTILKARGLTPASLAPESRYQGAVRARSDRKGRGPRPRPWGAAIGGRELAVFTRRLAMLVRAGMPLVRSLEVLGRQEPQPLLRAAISDLVASIRAGGTFSDGLQRHPRIFDRLYVNMVRAGESGGVLEAVLTRMAQFQEKSVQVRSRIKAAMTYPLIIVLVATAIVAALMIIVVPRFEEIFMSTLKGQALPGLTQAVLAVGSFLQDHALLTAGLVASVYLGLHWLAGTGPGRRWVDRWQLRLPVVGDLLLKAAVGRFTRTFGTLLASGVPILQALTITRETSGNTHIAAALATVHDRVKEGDDVAGPLRATGVFPDMVASMIEVGEETGALPEMLTRIADSYDEEVDNAVTALTSLVEPLMIVVMALMVGTIVIALFLPIVRIVQGLG